MNKNINKNEEIERQKEEESFSKFEANLKAENKKLLQQTRDNLWKQLKFID